MPHIHGIILIIIAALELALATYIFLHNPCSRIHQAFSAVIISVFIWVASLGISLVSVNPELVRVVGYIPWIGGMLIPVSLLYFSWVFPVPPLRLAAWKKFALVLPVLLFTTLIVTDIAPVVTETTMDMWRTNDKGPAYPFYNAFVLGYIGWAIANLYRRYRTADGIHRWQLTYLNLGIAIAGVIVILTNVIAPWLEIENWGFIESALGPEASIILLGFSAYVIFGKR